LWLATGDLGLRCDSIKRDAFVPRHRTGGAALPPFALLDGVSIKGVPEPSTWAMMVLGFSLLGYAGFRRRRTAASIV
jgi:hypothetical protein